MMMICFFIAHSAFAEVTVDGFCYLEGETDHSGTKVLFNAVSPSAVTDSVYTNTDGSYLIELTLGIYTVHFSHNGWQPFIISGELFFFENTTIEDVVLYSGSIAEVFGPQSGVWTSDYSYHVIGDISVSEGETLTIEPGVLIKFMDDYSFNIYGTLLAEGTEADSIIFTSGQVSCNPEDWGSIWYEASSNDNSIISYARIEYANFGIYCISSSPTIRNNTINNNDYTGVWCKDSSSPTISYNTISNNDYGIYCDITSFSPIISNNTIFNNNTYGIYCYTSSPTICNNTISNNDYGICCGTSSFPTISNNTIFNNDNSGIFCSYSSSPTINNNTICNNSRGIFCYYYSSPCISPPESRTEL